MPHILAIGKGVADYSMSQSFLASHLVKKLKLDEEEAWMLEKVFKGSKIDKRYSVLPDILFSNPGEPLIGMSARNAIYKKEAPLLAIKASCDALKEWSRPKCEITHIISVSCTGAITPGIEFKVHEALDLDPYVTRHGINFMGCFGAFKGLSIAHKIALADPKNRVLLVCTELCTLHFHAADTVESIVIHSLFADGAAACIVGSDLREGEKSLFEMVSEKCFVLKDSEHEMTWNASDAGFDMTLSAKVPRLIEDNIAPFVQNLIGDKINEVSFDFALHPGGKSILESAERALNVTSESMQSSWDVMKNYGNMSSATFLFVLDDLISKGAKCPYTVGLGFGPGLSIEGLLLKNSIKG